MAPPPDSPLPFAELRLTDDGERGGQAVEVLVDGRSVALLNACSVGYELRPHGRGVLLVGVPVKHSIEIVAGDQT